MSENIDEQFIIYIVKSLVGNPDAVSIERSVDDKGVLLELTVDPEDLGRVIGKRGATAQSLRTLLRALGTKNDARYNLKIIDNGDGEHSRNHDRPERAERSDRPQAPSQDDTPVAAATDEPTASNDDAADAVDDNTSDVVSKTRKELAEFDDLDL